MMKPKVLATGNRKLAHQLVNLIKEADTKTMQKRLEAKQKK